MNNQITKQIELKVPISQVWQALTNHNQFSKWFGANITEPFVTGKVSKGNITHPGYEHVIMEVVVQKIKPESYFSFTWHPYSIDPKIDYSNEPPTLIEFKLEKTAAGTLLKVTESGFDKIPEQRRDEAFKMNEGGWEEQMKNIQNYLAGKL